MTVLKIALAWLALSCIVTPFVGAFVSFGNGTPVPPRAKAEKEICNVA